MTATLNGRTCSEVRLTMPRCGNWSAWVTLSSAAAVSEAGGGVELVVAGLVLRGTVLPGRQGERGGLRSVELVGGYGGWTRPPRPKGFRADNFVKLSAYAADLALAAGERVELAAGVDRQLGVVAARLGQMPAGELLTQACALPAGATVVPWWMDLDGTTRLGARTGAAAPSSYLSTDSDELAQRYEFAEDDAAPLLPGGTFGGQTIEELRLEAGRRGVREVVTLAAPNVEPHTIASQLRRLLLAVFGPHVSARTLYRYSVRSVAGDGRIRAVPVRSVLAPDLDGLRVWPGIAGGRCTPKVGSEVLIQFADGDPCAGSACVVAFAPAIVGSKGIPDDTTLDGDEVLLGEGATRGVARHGDTVVVMLPPGTFTGALGTPPATTPISGTIVWAGQTMGTIDTSSAKVKSE